MSIAALELGKTTRFSGLVRLPGGQLGRQKILVVLQALNMDSTFIKMLSDHRVVEVPIYSTSKNKRGLHFLAFPGREPFVVRRDFFAHD